MQVWVLQIWVLQVWVWGRDIAARHVGIGKEKRPLSRTTSHNPEPDAPFEEDAGSVALADDRGAPSGASAKDDHRKRARRKGDWAILKRLAKDHMRPHLRRFGIAVVAMIVISLTTVASMWLLQPAMDEVLLKKNVGLLWMIVGAIVVVFLVKAVAMVIYGATMGYVTLRIVADLQQRMYKRLVYSDLSRLNSTHSGRFAAHFLNDVQMIKRTLGSAMGTVAKDLATAIGLVVFIYIQDFRLAFMATVVLPLIALTVRILSKRTRKAAKRSMKETGTMSALISDSLDGMRIVKAYGGEEREIERMSASVERRFMHQLKAMYSQALASPSTEAITGISLAAAILYGGLEAIAGRLSAGEFISILFAIGSAYRPLRTLAKTATTMSEGLAAAERVYEVIDVDPEIREQDGAKPLKVSEGSLTFRGVHFAYASGKTALDGIDLEAAPGSRIALVGPSGAGKSTILNLIPRFYDATGGSVLIDGQNVRDVTLESLRDHIAIVTQDPFLFDDTVRANIAYARPDATLEEIEQAARDAAAHDFIAALSEGYDTVVGEQGATLSGGQRQRIAIARALLADAPILLLDEATSALDTESERQVQAALRRLMAGRTTVIVAHRLSTVMDADRIYALDQGKVVEAGTHTDLLAKDGLYAHLFRVQLSDEPEVEPKTEPKTGPKTIGTLPETRTVPDGTGSDETVSEGAPRAASLPAGAS